MKYFLTIILSFCLINCTAQKPGDYIQIDIIATSAFKGSYLFMSIYKHNGYIKIVYKLKDSVNYKALSTDREYTALQKYIVQPLSSEISSDSLLIIERECFNIRQKYTYYNIDSLLLNDPAAALYTKLLYKVVSTSTDRLENNKANKNRFVLDGTHFSFNIKTPGQQRTVFAHSPTQKSHPTLYDLLHQTMNLYRVTQGKLLSDIKRTEGY